ncbi:ATP-dependent RNA helicase vasa-like [Metopolophium dirhodum]|uniref:ATP-dependent RNA helicase vasa-like n=1 Tax=Metopolophium dirhodum TaxID=44670 RepID=UPI002990367C|nr:ATP-dependent RNA helicase vasa-like [Metopolophium dirhodum]
MEETVVNSSDANKINQPAVGEWKNDENISYNDNYEQNIVETLNDTTLNDNSVPENVVIDTQENNCGFSNENTQDNWVTETDQKNHYGNKNNSGYRKGTGGYNKSNNGNNSYEKSYGNDSTSNNGHVRGRGRGRGRGFLKRYDEENESFRDEYGSGINNHGGNTAPGHRGRGRGFNRGRGGRRDQSGSGGWYGNCEDGHKKNENDKPKAPYIPPDIENEESISGIEAGLNFDKYNTIEVKVSGTNPPKSITSFHSSGLRTILLDNLSYCNFSTPTPIQNYAIPIIIDGRDLMASAQTGSGKTAAYVLPILHNLLKQPTQLIYDEHHCEPHVVIIAPTRELVSQISECVWKFSKGTDIRNGLLYGGTSVYHQKSKILQRGVHILTATPGRLIDFVEKGIVTFSSVKIFILDEADRMLDMGFKPDIEQVLTNSTMPSIESRQTVMFSATFPSEIQLMATTYLKSDYIFVAVGEIGGACKDVVQTVIEVTKFKKKNALLDVIKDMENCQGTIVFVERKKVADYTAAYLSEVDFPTTSIHGAREQPEREQALRDFKTNRMKILVATAVAARGLDIKGVNYVVNFDLPKTVEEYVHRIGRTGRLGNAGKAISFFDPESDGPLASELIRILKQADQEVPSFLKDASERIRARPAIDDFNDIRTNVDVTSNLVATEEEEEEW